MLSDSEILYELQEKRINIDKFNLSQLNSNSYNVRLGNWFIFTKAEIGKPNYLDIRWYADDYPVSLPHGTTVLGITKEIIGTREKVVAQLRSRSSTRRNLITVCDDAGFGDVGYNNRWTVELTCHANSGFINLNVNSEFAQMIFDYTGKVNNEYRGQYSNNDFPINMIPKKYRNSYIAYYSMIVDEVNKNPGHNVIGKDFYHNLLVAPKE